MSPYPYSVPTRLLPRSFAPPASVFSSCTPSPRPFLASTRRILLRVYTYTPEGPDANGSGPVSSSSHHTPAVSPSHSPTSPHKPSRENGENDENDEAVIDNRDADTSPSEQTQHGKTKRASGSQRRPALPRLTSQSRAPPSDFGSEQDAQTSQQPDGVTDSSDQPPPHQNQSGPVHVRGSKEIPLHPRKESASTSTSTSTSKSRRHRDNVSPPPPATTERTEDVSPELTRHQTPTPAKPSPPSESKDEAAGDHQRDENGEPEGQNAPIQIPKVTPISSGLAIPPNLAELVEGLEGKYVDEFGNILDWDGQVLGRAAGDLPSMIGRPVSSTGEIMDEDGQVVGYVAENDVVQRPSTPPSPQPIQGMGNGLKVDHHGNILDASGNVVGHFDPDHLARQASGRRTGTGSRSRPRPSQEARGRSRPRPTAAPSPSEIYLDVKSTNDGVQLIIKIPTVFNGGENPNIHIGMR
ncbi:hypothetical protein SODALDRAFT_19121 [Sodiomyces alkalinus F11]|uniref:LEA domain protein n=1 Tax=Sodiomyces alkalinus (strain CBS 110278 / VKM F-3762 / F11) TaxID=1314773 RepID=A0A3N2Q734_SODAK|nr:hypothetical protein SODALDRAFT_19121 [Sodiomyces alkalinus F11]ROT42599.1 hypothetical protein SODALDRAFT_19121 [Sodiomyces alkalinus F11]